MNEWIVWSLAKWWLCFLIPLKYYLCPLPLLALKPTFVMPIPGTNILHDSALKNLRAVFSSFLKRKYHIYQLLHIELAQLNHLIFSVQHVWWGLDFLIPAVWHNYIDEPWQIRQIAHFCLIWFGCMQSFFFIRLNNLSPLAILFFLNKELSSTWLLLVFELKVNSLTSNHVPCGDLLFRNPHKVPVIN